MVAVMLESMPARTAADGFVSTAVLDTEFELARGVLEAEAVVAAVGVLGEAVAGEEFATGDAGELVNKLMVG